MVASLGTLLLSLPALGFMGITATAGAKAFSHTFSLVLTFTILTNLTQYTYWKCKSGRSGTLWRRYGPVFLLAAATLLLSADLTRHCLQDAGVWDGPSSYMYREGCGPVRGLHGFVCLSLTGWLFSILFTYSGFGLMIWAVVWSSSLHVALRHAWSQYRLGAPTPSTSGMTPAPPGL